MADHGHRRCAGLIIIRREKAAGGRPHLQQIKEVSAHCAAVEHLNRSVGETSADDSAVLIGNHAREHGIVVAIVEEARIRKTRVESCAVKRAAEVSEFFRLSYAGSLLEHQSIGPGKKRGIGGYG